MEIFAVLSTDVLLRAAHDHTSNAINSHGRLLTQSEYLSTPQLQLSLINEVVAYII